MQWRLVSFLVGSFVGAGILAVGLYAASPHKPVNDVRRTLDNLRLQPKETLPISDDSDLDDVLELPTEFARQSGLHVLAAGSDKSRVQELIADASRISDRRERRLALAVFFRRFCDFDPQAALALAAEDPYGKSQYFQNVVWQSWARNDLAEAISAVNDIDFENEKVAAVQNLYAAYGYLGNDKTDRILSETGLEQNRQTRLRYLRVLLQESPVHVVNFINTEPSRLRRDEYINWFAYALDVNDPDAAYSYVGLFETFTDRSLYEDTIEGRFSRLNPVDTVRRSLAKGETGPNSEFHSAMIELASQDIDAAIGIFEELESSNARVLSALVIVDELANTNPQRALDWLRSLEDIRTDTIESALLANVAVSDPAFALETALALPPARRETAISNMVTSLALTSPEQAANLLDAVPQEIDMSRALRMFGGMWLTKNPSAAIGWLDSLEADRATMVAEFAVKTTVRTQPDTAVRLLSFLDGEKAAESAAYIVSELAATGDVDWARSVMEQLARRDIQGLEPGLARGLARHDQNQAIQFVQRLPDTETRDAAYGVVAEAIVSSGSKDAASVLPVAINGIEDSEARSAASRKVMVRLVRSDPERASQVLERLRIAETEKEVYRQFLLMNTN